MKNKQTSKLKEPTRQTTKKVKKDIKWKKLLRDACMKYEKALFVSDDNVYYRQIRKIRAELKKVGATLIMGDNDEIKAYINHLMSKPEEGDEDYLDRKDNWKPGP